MGQDEALKLTVELSHDVPLLPRLCVSDAVGLELKKPLPVCEAVKHALALKVFVTVPLTVFVGLRLRDNVIVALPE